MTQGIVKIKWLFLSLVGVLLFCLPAEAGKLLFWRFEERENQLFFSTDEGVQPEAQLIRDPTRLVIDLPGTTLGQQTARQSIGGIITEIRVGQFEQQTTRLVIELAPGYTLNPQEIKFRGASPTQWSVTLPTPERIRELPPQSLPGLPPLEEEQQSNISPNPSPPYDNPSEILQITRSGFFIRLGETEPDEILVRRSRDRRRIQFDLPGIPLPSDLVNQQLVVNRYGVSQIQFTQPSSSPPLTRVTLNISEESPDWQGSFRIGGLALIPEGGIAEVPTVTPVSNTPAMIQSIELVAGSTQLLIRGSQPLNASSIWNGAEQAYQITILNAQLADPFPETSLAAGSPIEQIRIRQADNTVVVFIQPEDGIQLGELNQPSETSLALQIQGTISNGTINVPPPQTTGRRPDSPPRIPNGRLVLVIDPGHGGKDPGAIGIGSIQEKNIVLPISLQVAEILERQGIQILFTRSDDRFISLDGRVQLANRAGADLFVSIHANAINLSRPDVNGLETYYFSSEGQRFANIIHNRILRNINMGDRGVRRARFYVLRRSSMPSVLIEVGFVTGREDIVRLRDPNERRRMAEAIAQGILDYIGQNRF